MNRIPREGTYEIAYPSLLRLRIAAARAVNGHLWSCDATSVCMAHSDSIDTL